MTSCSTAVIATAQEGAPPQRRCPTTLRHHASIGPRPVLRGAPGRVRPAFRTALSLRVPRQPLAPVSWQSILQTGYACRCSWSSLMLRSSFPFLASHVLCLAFPTLHCLAPSSQQSLHPRSHLFTSARLPVFRRVPLSRPSRRSRPTCSPLVCGHHLHCSHSSLHPLPDCQSIASLFTRLQTIRLPTICPLPPLA